jgi:hypothetical protein
MTSISSSLSSQTALLLAQAKLAADQAAKASADVLKADQQAIDDANSASSTTPETSAAPKGVVDISA